MYETPKQRTISLISHLPDDSTWADIHGCLDKATSEPCGESEEIPLQGLLTWWIVTVAVWGLWAFVAYSQWFARGQTIGIMMDDVPGEAWFRQHSGWLLALVGVGMLRWTAILSRDTIDTICAARRL